ncbi:hypothetical protein [Caulobacter sp. 17J80-11]|uniref:hypothetical protein n=1 Tax=Caulobacter sp. 17J80-11 TaxID=2763502 RepID=UPI00165358AC|nr:hypothetical protein [Caulobacter sp. 17J80-11]MBC6980664.1 hypothetical protein [Caulobacter sp. 17J80-11]
MSDLTGGPTTPETPTRATQPRQPRVAEVRPGAERAFASAARDVRRARRDLEAAEESLVAEGLDVAQAKLKDLQAWSARQTTSGRETIRLHPFTSCAALFGVGMITGILLTRR